MNVRTKLAELTANVRTHVELDALVARAGGIGGLFRTEFPGCAADEFLYEWESMKLKINREV